MKKLTMSERAMYYRIQKTGSYNEDEMGQTIKSCREFSKVSVVSVPAILQVIYNKLASGVWGKDEVLDFKIVRLYINTVIERNGDL